LLFTIWLDIKQIQLNLSSNLIRNQKLFHS